VAYSISSIPETTKRGDQKATVPDDCSNKQRVLRQIAHCERMSIGLQSCGEASQHWPRLSAGVMGPVQCWPPLGSQSTGTVAQTHHYSFHFSLGGHQRWSKEENVSPIRKDVKGTINSGEHAAKDRRGMAQKCDGNSFYAGKEYRLSTDPRRFSRGFCSRLYK